MPNMPQPFRAHHITRAIKAAQKAGIADPTVRVVLPNKTELHVGGSFGKSGGMTDGKDKAAKAQRRSASPARGQRR